MKVITLKGLTKFIIKDNKPYFIWEKFKGLTKHEEYFLSQIHSDENEICDLLRNGLEDIWDTYYTCPSYPLSSISVDAPEECNPDMSDTYRLVIIVDFVGTPVIGSIFGADTCIFGNRGSNPILPIDRILKRIDAFNLCVRSKFSKETIMAREDFNLYKDEFICSKKGQSFIDSVVRDIGKTIKYE